MNTALPLVITLPISILSLSISQAFAQEPDTAQNKIKMDETIVVTATRYKQDVDKIPGSIIVINDEDIARQLSVSDDLTSVLANLVPSMTPSRQKLSNQGENLRGRTALILVDGVPQNNPLRNGNRYGHPLDSAMVESIEVVSGASAVHGMGATGGIINYVTLSAKEGDNWKNTIGTRVNTSFEDDSTSGKLWYNLKHHDEKFDVVVAAALHDQGIYYDANGNPIGMNMIQGETQDSRSDNLFLKTGVNFGEQRLEFSGQHFNLEGKNNYVAVKGDFANEIPTTIEPGTPDGEPITNEVESYNLTYTHNDLAGGALSVQAFYQDFEAVYGRATWHPTPEQAKDQGSIISQKQGVKIDYTQYDLFDLDDSWVVGLDVLQDETQQYLLETGLGVTPEMSYFGVAPFIQGDILVVDDLRLSAGLRYENTEIEVDDHQTLYGYGLRDEEGNPYGSVDVNGGTQDFSQLVYNLGVVYSVTDNINIYGGFNQGFGLPDIGRVLRGNWVGNTGQPAEGGPVIDFMTMPAVEPVITDNYELGINFTNDDWQVSATSYYSLAKDGANLSLNSGGTYDVVRQRTEITGAEFTALYHVNDDIRLNALYSVVRGEVDSNGDGSVDSDMDLKNVSPDRIMLAMDYDITEALSSRLQVNTLLDISNEEKNQSFEGYTLADLFVQYDFDSYGRVSLGVENLTDEYYINYFSQIRNHSSYYFAGRGRNYSLGYEVSF